MNRICVHVAQGYQTSQVSGLFYAHIEEVIGDIHNPDGSTDILVIPVSRACRNELAKIPGFTVLPSLAMPSALSSSVLAKLSHLNVRADATMYDVMKALAEYHPNGHHWHPDNSY